MYKKGMMVSALFMFVLSADEKIVKQIADGTPEKMMSFKEKLNSDEMKALVPVIRSFVKK